jgi:class 3 adenylate cyclase/CheY-like chemotaxis protein
VSDDPRARLRHDLRTPLHQIIGYCELLEEEARDRGLESRAADLAKIRGAAHQVLAGIDHALPPSLAHGVEPVVFREDGAASVPPTSQPVHGARLLVVDDSELNRDMLSRRLQSRGYDVETATDGVVALQLLDRRAYDLILLDVMMPGVTGLEVLRRVRARWSESDLPVIMATARDGTDHVVEALRLGANDYVTKPLDFPVILARVAAHLALKRQKEEIRRLADDLELRNRFIQRTFGRYLSDEVVESLLDSPSGLKIGGEQRRVTILMSDLRGFTSVTESLAPEQVVRLLNSYLGAMSEVILAYQGTIDEFVGDAILAIFGAPIARPDDARRAVACAVAMQQALAALNQRNQEAGLPRLGMGIGIHSGDVVVGNMGSEKRTKYGVVGSPVNHAGRIESFTVGGQVFISEATYAAAGPDVIVGERLVIEAKGAREPIEMHSLVGIGAEYGLMLPEEQVRAHVLDPPLPVRYHFVDGKRVGPDTFDAQFVELSTVGGVVRVSRRFRPLTNLRIELPDLSGDLEAKVLTAPLEAAGCYAVRFTSVPPEAESWIRRRLEGGAPAAGGSTG